MISFSFPCKLLPRPSITTPSFEKAYREYSPIYIELPSNEDILYRYMAMLSTYIIIAMVTIDFKYLDVPLPTVNIAESGVPEAGQTYTLLCRVVLPDGLTTEPEVTWLSADGDTLTSAGEITVGRQQVSGNPSRLTTYMIQFSPLLTSHGGMYTCQATVSSPFGTIQQTVSSARNVSVQGKLFSFLPSSALPILFLLLPFLSPLLLFHGPSLLSFFPSPSFVFHSLLLPPLFFPLAFPFTLFYTLYSSNSLLSSSPLPLLLSPFLLLTPPLLRSPASSFFPPLSPLLSLAKYQFC